MMLHAPTTIAHQRLWLAALDVVTQQTFSNMRYLLAHKADDDPDGDWDDEWDDEDPENFSDHFNRHAKNFNAKNWNEYAKQSREFYQKAQFEKLPTVEYPKGAKIAIYDPKTNTFAVYKPNGKTVTFYKPENGRQYFENLINTQVTRGGRLISPLPEIPLIDPLVEPVLPDILLP